MQTMVDTGAPDHWKFARLASDLKIDVMKAFGHVVALWCYAMSRKMYDGRLHDHDAFAIAHEAKWKKKAQDFIEALIRCRLMEKEGDLYTIHHFHEQQGYHDKELEKDRQRKRRERMQGRETQADPVASTATDPLEGVEEEIMRQLMQKARKAKIPNVDATMRKYITGWKARSNAGKVEEILMDPWTMGKTVIEIQDHFFPKEEAQVKSKGGTINELMDWVKKPSQQKA